MFLAQITYPTHLMNTDSSPVLPDGRQPSNQANPLGLWDRRQPATVHICHRHLLLWLSPKDDTHLTAKRKVEGSSC